MNILSIVSLCVGVISIVLAMVSMFFTSKTEKRIIQLCERIQRLICGNGTGD